MTKQPRIRVAELPADAATQAKLDGIGALWSARKVRQGDAETRFRLLAAKGSPRRALRVLGRLDAASGSAKAR
jgi:hypothetical protein